MNIGSLSTGGRVIATKADLAKIALTNPVCTEIGEKVALSRRVENHWRWANMFHFHKKNWGFKHFTHIISHKKFTSEHSPIFVSHQCAQSLIYELTTVTKEHYWLQVDWLGSNSRRRDNRASKELMLCFLYIELLYVFNKSKYKCK